MTVSEIAIQIAELVRQAFIEGYSVRAGRPADADYLAKAWVNSRAFENVAPGEVSHD